MKQLIDRDKKAFVASVEKALKVKFKNKELLLTALSHSSYAHEQKTVSNERLEFLGDSVLGFIISERIYADQSLAKEGKLSQLRSRIVSEEALSALCKEKGFNEFLLVGAGEKKNELSRAMIADEMEAIIGAIFLDQGLKTAKKFVLGAFSKIISDAEALKQTNDSKSLLQEKYYKQGVRYKTEEVGSLHDPIFESTVYVGGKIAGKGSGKNKRESQKVAAARALEKLDSEMKSSAPAKKKYNHKKWYKKTNKVKTSEVQKN